MIASIVKKPKKNSNIKKPNMLDVAGDIRPNKKSSKSDKQGYSKGGSVKTYAKGGGVRKPKY